MTPSALATDIAIVGTGLAVPGANSPESLWKLLTNGGELFCDPPAARWRAADFFDPDPRTEDKTYQSRAAFITDVDHDTVDDYCRIWLRHCVHQAMQEVTYTSGDRVGLYLGHTADNSQHQEEALVRDSASIVCADARVAELLHRHFRRAAEPGRYLPHRMARDAITGLLPTETTIHVLDSACSSALYAIDLGIRELRSGDADIAVCGGVSQLTPTNVVLFSKNHGLSRGGAVRALDAAADGVLFSDSAAVIVLKRLDRALAAGDTIHGILAGVGLSADGKGTAIYKPAATGQVAAIRRALTKAECSPESVRFVVAHATGTPIGDTVELGVLRSCYSHPITVVSNKSVIGHGGWAAGAVSVIHLLLALQHETIPPQHRFRTPPIDPGAITIPTSTQSWARDNRQPRTGAVCGFGFGGTNAHAIVREHVSTQVDRDDPDPDPHRRSASHELVIVGWAVRQPPDREADFGLQYPTPTLDRFRMPARVVRRIDRTQLMLVECVHDLTDQMRAACSRRRDRVGVVIGHFGPTRALMHCRNRIHLDELSRVTRDAGEQSLRFMAAHREQVTASLPAASEDSFPGEMPNIVAARLSNYFDWRGLGLTVDMGEASLVEAFTVAGRYLADVDLDIALVGAVSGNTLPAWTAMLRDTLGEVEPHEGAYLFAVTTRTVAEQDGLPIHAVVLPRTDDPAGVEEPTPPNPQAGPRASYCGAEGGPELAAFLAERHQDLLRLQRRPDPTEPPRQLLVRREEIDHRPARSSPVSRAVERYTLSLVPRPVSVRPVGPALIPPACLLLTNNPAVLSGLELPEDTAVVDIGAALPFDQQTIDEAIRRHAPDHLRVVADLTAPPAGTRRLHEALFLAARTFRPRLDERGSIVTVVLAGIGARRRPHPWSGLFTGLTKALRTELTTEAVKVVVHEAPDMRRVRDDVERELRSEPGSPVVYFVGGERLVPRLRHQPSVSGTIPLSRDSVVVCAGGSRGIGAQALIALATAVAPRMFVIGSTPIEGVVSGALPDKKAFLRARTCGPDAVTSSTAIAEYDQLCKANDIRITLDALSAHCGRDRVTYLCCDLRDSAAVHNTIDLIHRTAPMIDLLLNVAGTSRPAALGRKRLSDFSAVRDVKLFAHANLSHALRDRRPRLWCNFGSATGMVAVPGEADYCSANDFLFAAALAADPGEFTLGWAWWSETGLAADNLTRSVLGRRFTPITTADAIRCFLEELADRSRPAATAYLGDRERAEITRQLPGCLAADAPTPPSFYIESESDSTPATFVANRTFDQVRDGYLLQHLVDRYPTMPGSFFLEIAAEAALRLVPGRVPTCFENLELLSFLRVYASDRPRTVRIVARLQSDSHEESVVHVHISGDIVTPTGHIAVHDKPYAAVTVRLRDEYPHPPGWSKQQHVDLPPVPDSYDGNHTVKLQGMFRSLADVRGHSQEYRARLRLDPREMNRWFPHLAIPVVTLDAMVQLSAQLSGGANTAHLVPRLLTRVDLYRHLTDVEAAAQGNIELWAAGSNADTTDTCCGKTVAVSNDGCVLLELTDVYLVAPLGGYEPATKR